MKEPVLLVLFSGAYEAQGFGQWLDAQGVEVALADATAVEGTCFYCSPEARVQIGELLPPKLPRLRWTDSGDYHYMSLLLALRETEPFHLLLLDHHPDNQAPAFGAEVLSCGSWVKALEEEQPLLRSVFTIGPEGGEEAGLAAWLSERKGERVYVSLDKDILDRPWARTAWTQGTYSLRQVEGLLGRVLESGVELAAIDVCGEMAPGRGASPEDQRINKETNIDIYTFLNNHLK